MLFILLDDLVPFCRDESGQRIEGLQNLLLAVRKGDHALAGSQEVFRLLSQNPCFGAREKSMAKHLLNRRAELTALAEMVSRKVLVSAGVNGPSICRQGNGWLVSASVFSGKFTEKVEVLAENMIDAELYVLAGHHHRINNRIKGVTVCAARRGGGGSQLDVEFGANLQAGYATLAISDGDKQHPEQQQQAVASRCARLIESEAGVGWYAGTDCYAVENLIPTSVFERACQHPDRINEALRIQKLDQCVGNSPNAPSKYFCWKTGLSLKKVFEYGDTAKRNYWLGVARKLGMGAPAIARCLDHEQCTSEPCQCILAQGFGEGGLRQVKDWAMNRSAHDSANAFKSSAEWRRLGEVVFEAAVALPQQRV